MRVLLDTNIIIHRENKILSNESIGHLFYWLDRLKYTKLVHPYSISEIGKYNDKQVQQLYKVKLDAYTHMKTVVFQNDEFKELLKISAKTENDLIDNQLLCELYNNRVDILITEDRKMRAKANLLGLNERVFSINSFIELQTANYPDLITYKALSVKKELFGNIDIENVFFNTFKMDYEGFEKWFSKKCDEEAYICQDDQNKIQGFLYLKVENEDEQYNDISPLFIPKRRLKVGTFKVEATGFRLGERFLKIIFDNAILQCVDEIYVTLFEDRVELKALESLLKTWGFIYHGKKTSRGRTEIVLIKHMKVFDDTISSKENFPNIDYRKNKYFLPILAKYHTRLIPDSILNTEKSYDFIEKTAEKYSLEKVYLSLTFNRYMKAGELVMIYRIGEGLQKAYSSLVSTLAIISDVKYGFKDKEEFLRTCQNRTVFSKDELEELWRSKGCQWVLVKFIPISSLNKRPILKELWDNDIISRSKGPRPFDIINENNFDKIISMSKTELYKGANK